MVHKEEIAHEEEIVPEEEMACKEEMVHEEMVHANKHHNLSDIVMLIFTSALPVWQPDCGGSTANMTVVTIILGSFVVYTFKLLCVKQWHKVVLMAMQCVIIKSLSQKHRLHDQHISSQYIYSFTGPEPPPFMVPHVQFVEAGLALCHNQGGSKPGVKTGSTQAIFLLEELIEGNDDMFVKFIHNMDANPLLDELDHGYDMAEFFVFMQHVQYIKTSKLAFISDYQAGMTQCIQVAQSISNGCDIFGEGNIDTSVSKFEDQHACNEYCEWFGLETFAKEVNDNEVAANDNEVAANDNEVVVEN
ncbi:uncharacterized protein BJ212DRAFT_1295535 [Suillus subaureus]|uniref:Alpha-type protein kinase domain-containing protein n=1 Tax=Suillus subaureus TaxID=48587 RepID=A0A9P7EK00_9AGAM|nr:uncharacterized protein BJ212DRAFT_1295535 [Suillus subaureus]KAG1824347.1 hypothetical protein BJ212DRAFT_1295535 [Suillus subaureus]